MAPETVSVVLRRQVPPGPAEAARSWLGGLPHMSADIEWPRSVCSENPKKGERPLHFLAQICCADLPDDLWLGLGPRDGWLLLFIDPNQGSPEGTDGFHIIHVRDLGPERAPPVDLGPVHDGVYTGGSYAWLPTEQVPSTWRRWPIDIMTFPNTLLQRGGRAFATPDDFASTLYPGAEILPDRDLKTIRPYTFDQALRAVRNLSARMRAEPAPVVNPYSQDLLREEGSIDRLRGTLMDRVQQNAEREDSDTRNRQLERMNRCLSLVDGCETPASLLRTLEQRREEHRSWRLAIAKECDSLADLLQTHDPQSPLSAAQWEGLQAQFATRQWSGFELRIDYPTGAPRQLDLGVFLEQARLTNPGGVKEEALMDWIDPDTRSRVPTDHIDDLQAVARGLASNRPHRMGGYHDGVQSDAVEGATDKLLLFQIASDDGMDWCWGDAGAYYFWIRPGDLGACDFSDVEISLECH